MSIDRVAVVTGATRGLGRRTAAVLAERGYGVVATHRGDPSAAAPVLADIAAAGGDGIALPLELGDTASIQAFAAALPAAVRGRWSRAGVDVLVHNAGIGRFGPLSELTEDDVDAVLSTNVRGTILLTQALAPQLAEGASIVLVSSSLTRHVSPGTAAYTASKAAVEAFGRSIAVELGPRGIRVNSIAPGPSATDFNGGAMRDDPALRAHLAAHTALGRVGRPDDIAHAIAALVEPELRWVTAERIEVSGGVLL